MKILSLNVSDKKTWQKPIIQSELTLQKTLGLGGGGPDFGSELS